MNFPMEFAFVRFLFWLVDTAGVGGFLAILLGGGSLSAYALTLLWISRGAGDEDAEVYVYPTPALHAHEEEL